MACTQAFQLFLSPFPLNNWITYQCIWSLYLKSTDICKKLHTETSYDPTIPLPDIYSRELKTWSQRNLYTNVQEPFFITVKKWKQPKCATDEWINQMCYIQTMGYYSAIKTNEVLIYAAIQMNLAKHYAKWKNPDIKAT